MQEYATIFAGAGNNPGEKSLEDKFFEKEVRDVDIFAMLLEESFATGGHQYELLHAAIPLWCVLFLHSPEGTGVQKCCVDS